MDGDVFHPGNEIKGVSTSFTFAEAVPDVFAQTDPKLRWIVSFVDGTRPTQTITALFEAVGEAIMLNDLFHSDG